MYEKSPQIVHKLFTSNKKPHFLSRKWVFGGLGRNRTCILGSGNPHTIRCTTRPWALENQSRPWGRLWGCSGGRTRTSDLRVMSPTSYQLLYPAIRIAKVFTIARFFIRFMDFLFSAGSYSELMNARPSLERYLRP